MAVANVGYILTTKGPVSARGVLLIDWDLEAPGLHRYFAHTFRSRLSLGTSTTSSSSLDQKPGLIDFFTRAEAAYRAAGSSVQPGADKGDGSEPAGSANDSDPFAAVRARVLASFAEFVLPIADRGLFLLKAGRFDASYPEKIRRFDWERFHRRDPRFFGELRFLLMERYDYVLIDSRTGLTDTSGICAQQMPEKLVLVFVPNHQSLDGVLDVARLVRLHRLGSSDLRPLVSFPLAARIDGKSQRLRDTWRRGGWMAEERVEGYQKLFEDLFTELYELDECDLEAYFDATQIAHESDYAYGEQIAARAGTTDLLSLGHAYANFSRRLTSLAAPWEPLPEERELEEVKRTARAVTAQAARGTRIVKWVSASVSAAALLAAVVIVAIVRETNLDNLRAEKVLSAVAASPDPLEKALLLVELLDAKEPPGGLAVAKEVVSAPLPAAVLRGSSKAVLGLAFSPAGDRIAEIVDDRTVRLFKADGTGDAVLFPVSGGDVTTLGFSPSGQLLVVGDDRGAVSIWSLLNWVVRHLYRAKSVPLSVAFDSDEKAVLVATAGGVDVVDMGGGLQRHLSATNWTGCAFAPRANRMVAIAAGQLVTWDFLNVKPVGQSILLRNVVNLALSGDGRLLMTVSDEGTVLWELTPNGIKTQLFDAARRSTDAFALNLSGSLFAYPLPEGSVVVRTTTLPPAQWQLRGQRAPIRAMALSDGNQLVTGADDGSAWVWNLAAKYRGTPEWGALLHYLRQATTACLSVSQRTRLLAEGETQASKEAEACEQKYGRTLGIPAFVSPPISTRGAQGPGS